MITKTNTLNSIPNYPLEKRFPVKDTLFFDIETTGLSPKSAVVYLIGVVYFQHNCWYYTQWMSQTPQEEVLILAHFFDTAKKYTHLVHFNGATFDVPFVNTRAETLGMPSPLPGMNSFDLYKHIRPLKSLLGLSRANQTTLEAFLGCERKDTMNGGELIQVYHSYVHNPEDAQREHLLLLHNHDDIEGLLSLCGFLAYEDMKNGCFQPVENQLLEDDLLLRYRLETPLPRAFSRHLDVGYLSCTQNLLSLMVKSKRGVMKYYFDNYKDYYYLPQEDMAIHKSVASYVDKEHRRQAKAGECYVKQEGIFYPQPAKIFTPAYKLERKDSLSYFQWKKDCCCALSAQKEYALTLLKI